MPLKIIQRGDRGQTVTDLQLILSGFRGTYWDGIFGPGTELQVVHFQKEFMGQRHPHGKVDRKTFDAILEFTSTYAIDFNNLKCHCERCPGFGNGRGRDQYRGGKPQIEAYHQCEYPGIHRATLSAFMAAQFYCEKNNLGELLITSGYRCHDMNKLTQRTSTNHMGKALDFDILLGKQCSKKQDMINCDGLRGLLVKNANFQLGWNAANVKSLEPSYLAPTWLHIDVRNYSRHFLKDTFFITSESQILGDSSFLTFK